MTPRTEAGRRLFFDFDRDEWAALATVDHDAILAIEQEAAEAERARLYRAVVGLPTWDKRTVPGGFHVNRSAVLAILDPRSDTYVDDGETLAAQMERRVILPPSDPALMGTEYEPPKEQE